MKYTSHVFTRPNAMSRCDLRVIECNAPTRDNDRFNLLWIDFSLNFLES